MSVRKTIMKLIKSLRFRLVLILILIGILPSIFIRFGVLKYYEQHAIENRIIAVISQGNLLASQILKSNYIENTESEVISTELIQISNIYDGRILLINSSFNIIKDTYDIDTGKTIISEEVILSFEGQEITIYDSENSYIELTIPLTDVDTQEIIGVLLFSVSTDDILFMLDSLENVALILGLISTTLVAFLAGLISIRLINPFARMSKAIIEIQNGYDKELNINSYSETEEISYRFNQLFNRMKLIDESRAEFVSNVSHELKTPLTSMKVLADSLVAMGDVPNELYKDFMIDIGNEIDRETKIINDLLSLVRMDKAAGDLNISEVNINELMEQILKRLRPIADKQNVELILESFRPVTAEVDEVKLSLAISNLIENAIKYNKSEGWVRVMLNADHQYFYIKVEDTGIGIPEEYLDHIYERFYRVDKSHSREIGGTGLGLAITRNAVLMHRGAIKVFSTEGEGTIFNIRIPLTYMSS
ncbi:MAG: sensor histidine kinase [Lachnospiraceae bacterium]